LDATGVPGHAGYVSRSVLLAGIVLAASGLVSPPLALLGGLVYALFFVHPHPGDARLVSKLLLQVSVVGLGFGMNMNEVVRVGRSGFFYTALSITFAMLLGWALGKVFAVRKRIAYLISAGTAICGGSAIAAVAPITNANEEEIAVSLGTVFVLNSVALFVFPAIGSALHMTQTQFGLWSALAIHDTSSVVAASAKFGAVALGVGTTVKLARALWIVPLSFATSLAQRSKARIQRPWFILFFCAAAALNTYVPALHTVSPILRQVGVVGLTVTLFLIGTGLSKQTLRQVGARPLLQGVILWVAVAAGSLGLIYAGWIRL
jgi:uncharacterized integral membrane protein (TIGR00698 family)